MTSDIHELKKQLEKEKAKNAENKEEELMLGSSHLIEKMFDSKQLEVMK